ncbi:MAG TPA: glycosyltransferase family 2 protein [Ramlibacter sp.]|nr:glycosyltransferase family 2 protein [Ramlibacter sp.]
MNTFAWFAATLWILVVLALVVVLITEVMAGFSPAGAAPSPAMEAPSHVVLMPAHDEAGGIAHTVAAVLAQLSPRGRLLVVADNCSDDTAAKARAAGAEVIERSDPFLRGKGYALAFGVARLRQEPPEVLLVLDADCVPAPGSLDTLAIRAAQLLRPVQALDLMLAQPGSPLRVRMAAFAWAMHNDLRPRGLYRLGLPCQLMGTGMALPWCCVREEDLASGHLAEDVRLGLSLADAGYAPCFCPEARVESWFPVDRGGLDSQRKRWEHGHLSTMLSAVPRTLWRGLRFHNAAAVALALDLCVPPLALLALLVTLSCGLGAWIAGADFAQQAFAAAAAVSAIGFAVAVLLAWWSVGRRWVTFAELVSAPVYVLKKLPLYLSFAVRRQREWIRTSRPS